MFLTPDTSVPAKQLVDLSEDCTKAVPYSVWIMGSDEPLPTPSETKKEKLPQTYDRLQSEAKALIARHFPKAVGTTLGDETTFTLNLRDYQVHNGSKTGTLAQQTTRQTGPAAIGFRLTIQRLKAPLVSQAVLPQFFDRPYWKSYGNTHFDTKTGEGIAVYYDYGSALPPTFQDAMLKLLQLSP